MCLSFIPIYIEDGSTLVIAIGDGLGYNIKLSTDGGQTWTNSPNQDGYIFGLNGATAYGTSAVACGDLATQYSINKGVSFNSSAFGGPGGAVYVRNFAGNAGYGQIGVFNDNTNGVSVSTDFGITWTSLDASSALNESGAVGAAFLPNNLYLVVGADGPQAVIDPPQKGKKVRGEYKVHRRGRIVVRVYEDGTKETLIADGAKQPTLGAPFRAQLAKSTDGGKTWTAVETIRNRFEFQGIDCGDTTGAYCCAVGEALSGVHAGAYISCNSGGIKYNITHNDTKSGASLIDIRAISQNEFWAVGGYVPASGTISAVFWHSTDSGKTWIADTTLSGYYATAINCNNGHCFASLIDANQNSYLAHLAPAAKSSTLRGKA